MFSDSSSPRVHAMPSHQSFADSSAVVTGSSSGIGQITAIELAKAGVCQLLVHYRSNRKGAEATAAMARQAGCRHVVLMAADLSDPAERTALVNQAFDQLGQVDSWINLAGADVLTGEAASWDFATKLDHLWNIDVRGTIDLSRQVAQRLRQQVNAGNKEISNKNTGNQNLPSHGTTTPPSITFIGWDQAPLGMEGDAGQMFGPVKAAVMAFANSMAQELAPEIRVNTIAPGWIQTSWGESTSDYWDDRAKEQSLMNRWGRPDDVARAILHVADPNNTFATGQTIPVNGGWDRRFTMP